VENGFFKNIEQKTGVRMTDIMDLVNSLQNADFRDERTVRHIIKRVAALANKPVPGHLEDQIVDSIVKDGNRLDFQTISDMLNKKR